MMSRNRNYLSNIVLLMMYEDLLRIFKSKLVNTVIPQNKLGLCMCINRMYKDRNFSYEEIRYFRNHFYRNIKPAVMPALQDNDFWFSSADERKKVLVNQINNLKNKINGTKLK